MVLHQSLFNTLKAEWDDNSYGAFSPTRRFGCQSSQHLKSWLNWVWSLDYVTEPLSPSPTHYNKEREKEHPENMNTVSW